MSQGGPNSVAGSGADPVESLTGNSGGAVSPTAFNIDVLGNNATGIDVVGTPASSILTIIGLPSSETQVGTIEIATDAEAVAAADTTRALVPSNLGPIFASPPALGSTTPNSGEFTVLDVDNININGNTISSTDTNGNISLEPDGSGAVVIPNNNLYVGSASPSNPYNIAIEDSVAGAIGLSIQNTNVGATAAATQQIIVEPATADPYTLYNINGAATFSLGIDNSDSDQFKLTTGSSPSGGTTAINVTSAGIVTLPAGALDVPSGGTGVTSTTAYAVLCGGTTATNPIQSVASLGSSGTVLTSNGAGALPTFQTPTVPGLVYIDTQNASASANLEFKSIPNYDVYMLVWEAVRPATDGAYLTMEMSNDDGSTYITTGYTAGCNHAAYNSTTYTNTNSTAHWPLTGPIDGGSTSNHAGGDIKITNCNTGNVPYINGTGSFVRDTDTAAALSLIGGRGGSTGLNAFRVLMSAGNITSGTFRLYGLRNS